MLLPFVPASRQSARRQRLSSAVRSVAEALEGRVLLSASLVKDINTVPAPSSPYGFVDDNGIALFAATDVAHGTALWRSDGTAAGTSLVKNVTPEALTNISGNVYFGVAGTSADAGLWTTDGTTAGTTELVPFGPLQVSGNVTSITGVGNKIFFIAGPVGYTGESALWVSDGTPGGTHSLIGSVLRGTQSGQSDPDFAVLGGQVYVISDASGGPALYRTDGSTTTLVKAIQIDPTYGEAAVGTAGGRVYFADLENGINELWETDGTAAGTAQVTTGTLGLGPQPIPPVEFGGAAYFLGRDATGIGLWKSDGTPGNTTLIDRRALFTAVAAGPYLYYRGHSSATSDDLFRTDGTAAGVLQLTSLPAHDFPYELTDVGGTLFFSNVTGPNQLWKSNGTPAGTVVLNPAMSVGPIGDIHGTAFINGNGQLWKSDGTAAGTQLVKLINPATLDSFPSSAIDANGELFFSADDGVHGQQLWKSDGTDAGTVLVKQLDPSGVQYGLTHVNGTVYFVEQTSSDPSSYTMTLYRSDGTAGGTVPVKQLQLGPLDDSIPPHYLGQDLTVVGSKLYFFEYDGTATSIWQTTPGSSTASQVATLPQGVFSYNMISFDGKLLLNAFDTSSYSAKLFLVQGSSLVALGPEALSGDAFNGAFYYLTWQPTPQTGGRFPVLYRTDGTAASTVQLQQFPTDHTDYTSPDPKLYAANGVLLFSLPSGVWVSDGTAASSHRVASNLQLLDPPVVFNGEVYFIAADPSKSNVRQLWKTDGTSSGTVLVKDKLATQFQDVQLAALTDKVYFTAWDATMPWQLLWQTDGTPLGTQPVPGVANNLRPNFFNNTTILATSGGKLYFSPQDPLHGKELWKLESAPPPLLISGTNGNDTITLAVTAGGNLQATVNGSTTSYTAVQYGGGITIDTGSSSGTGDHLNIVGLPAVAVQVQSEGSLSVYVGGGSRGMQDVAATTLTIGAAGAGQGKISLTLDDGADTTARSVTLDAANSANAAYGTVTGLSAGTIAFNAKQTVSPVTIYAGGGGNSITVNHTPAGPNINLSTGAGNDTVNVLATAAGTVLNVNGKSGTDTVNVGGANQHSLANISGVVNVSNPLGQTHLTIDDSADPASRTATLDTFTAGADVYGSLTGLSPGPIDFDSTQVAPPVVIDAGNGGNHFVVKQTPPATVINLNTGNGNDTVNVSAAGAGTVLNINGQAGQDAVNIGDSGVNSVGLRNINGVVNVSNPLGATAITADNTDGLNGDITLDTFDAAGAKWGTLQGLAPGVINFSSVGLGSLFVSAAGNSTALTVKNTPGGGPINFSRIALIEVMGVAAGQSLNIPFGTPDVISANIDLYTGRVAGGVFVDTETLNVRGAAGQTYNGLGAVYNEDTLVDINVSSGTYVLPDLDLTFGHSGITFDGADTHAVFSQAEHLESVALSSGATATLAPGSDLFCQGLTLGGKLDIGTNQVHDPIDAFNSVQQIRDWIKSGLAGGNGITSSAVDATHTIGFSSAGLVRWTLYGDANLDGVVNFSDLLIVAQNYGRTNAYWYQGDFNYDGKVDFADLLKVGQNFGRTTATIAAASAGVNSPQPLDLLALKRRRAHR